MWTRIKQDKKLGEVVDYINGRENFKDGGGGKGPEGKDQDVKNI